MYTSGQRSIRRPPSSLRVVLSMRGTPVLCHTGGPGRARGPKDMVHDIRPNNTPLTGFLRAALAERRRWWAEERERWRREGLTVPADLRD